MAVQRQEALRGQAHQRCVPGDIQIRGEGRCRDGSQRAIGVPGIAAIVGTETLAKVDLVAVASLDIVLNPIEGLTVLYRSQVGGEACGQRETCAVVSRWLAQSRSQITAFSRPDARL